MAVFITGKLLFIALLLLIITAVETLAYSARLSGARVGLIATALSLFSSIVLISRFSTLFQQPMTAKLADLAPEGDKLGFLEDQYRFLLFVSSAGVVLGILLFPTFIGIFSRTIVQLSEEKGSYFQVLKKALTAASLKKAAACFRLPRLSYLNGITYQTVPKRLFAVNVVISGIYTVGILAALYASALAPEYKGAAMMSSGIINGFATILLTLFVDPKASILADRVANKKAGYVYLKSYSLTMVTSKFAGTLFAQALFIPAAYYVAWFSKWI
ncbi:lipid II flippase Amj family protein [Bacillus infantis]|uniref:lipid II flippase Amj family protein n=1 Tax=Bacillus infantis TaxID=324767 RepID=UPI001CD5B178|nr:lipid II flippase Amj family protein [Bacillus infantis]MCA1038278.1 lipid II flippase Amj family protein [Bacillus infantis]